MGRYDQIAVFIYGEGWILADFRLHGISAPERARADDLAALDRHFGRGRS